MQLEDYLEFVAPDQIRVRGHRIGIEHIVERFQQGLLPEEIRRSFPGLRLEQIYATLTYYLRNKEEVDVYMAQQREALDEEVRGNQARESAVVERLRSLYANQMRARSTA